MASTIEQQPEMPPLRVSSRIKDRRRLLPTTPLVEKEEADEGKGRPPVRKQIIFAVLKKKAIVPLVSSPKKRPPTQQQGSPAASKKPRPTVLKKPPPAPPLRPPFGLYPEGSRPSFANGLASVVQILRQSRNIAVLTGAGISVSCGIPDFRSQGVGLYSVLDCEALGLSCPEDLFDWEFFQSNPAPFFQFARKLYFPLADNQKVQPSDSHKLLRLLQDRKQLLRVYSQNIDGLEEQAGVERKRVVYAHGSLQWATCLTCKRKVPAADLETSILEGIIPCCRALLAPRSPTKRSVSSGSSTSAGGTPQPVTRREPSARQLERSCAVGDERSDSDRLQRRSAAIPSVLANTCGGVLKPNVTFFGQVLPDQVSRSLEADLRKVDALIVIGTSLSVAPISKVIGFLPAHIPRILINRTIVHPAASTLQKECNPTDEGEKEGADFRENYVFDAYLLGNCDDVTRALVKQLLATDDEAAHAAAQNLAHIGRLLSEVREERQGQESEDNTNREEVLYRAEAWETAKVPAERVFLFPGAQPQTGSSSPLEETSAPIVKLQEVCHCNTCDKRIRRGSIHKCLHCFDYDLCSVCFPKFAPTHYDGQHQFGIEKVLSVTSRK